jgi:hypothetical protein
VTGPDGLPVLNFVNQDAPITFDRCSFGGNPTGHAPHIGLSRDARSYCKFMDCWVANASAFIISNDLGRSWGAARFDVPAQSGRLEAIYQTYRVSNGLSETIYIPYTNYHEIWITGVSNEVISGNTLTFSCSNVAQLQESDILFWTILPQGYSNQSSYWVPALQITNISGTTVTCALLFDPNQYAPTDGDGIAGCVGLAPNHWAPTQPLTCSTTASNNWLSASTTASLYSGAHVLSCAALTPESTTNGAMRATATGLAKRALIPEMGMMARDLSRKAIHHTPGDGARTKEGLCPTALIPMPRY